MKKKLLYYVLIVLGFLVLSYAFVPEVLKGKIVNQSDISGYIGMSREMTEWNAAHPDDPTAWTGAMFGGMPTTTIQASTKGDWTQKMYDFLLTGRRPATYLFLSLLGAFLMMLAFGVGPVLAVGGAIAVTFCAYNLQIIQVGHNTKMQALAFLPWVLAAFAYAYRKALQKKPSWPLVLLGAAAFGLTVSFQVKANHPQISYYLALLLFGFALALLIALIVRNKALIGRFFAVSALLLVLGGVGIATNASKLLPTMAYTPHSMRGGSSDGKTSGLQLDYATSWSYGWEELPNLMIPNFNGGSSSGPVNPARSETYKVLKRAGQPGARNICKNLPLYWGPQPFTAGPMYIGAVTLFLFLMGLMLCCGWQKWWLAACTLLAVFLALGNHFMAFTKFFYDFVPLYNKFRTVSMALVILQFTLPLLGFIALDRIMRGNEDAGKVRRAALWSFALSGGFCLLCVLFPGIAGDFKAPVDEGMPEVLSDALAADRMSLLRADALRSLLLIAGAFALVLWGNAKPRPAVAKAVVSAGFCILVLADLFLVGKRYLDADDFVTPKDFSAQFAQRPADRMILEDKDLSYRVADLSVNTFNDSHPSYWHKNIGGYSPAKLQRYQEYIEAHLSGELALAKKYLAAGADLPYLDGLSKLNCRYLVVAGDRPPVRNPYAKGNAWFEEDGAPIELVSYAPNALRYRYSSEKGGKAVFSEVYYPDGWTLTLEDGTPLEITLEEEILRGAFLPAGDHELEMRFAPLSYKRGEAVSRASSILLILLVLLSLAAASFYGSKS
ncbi:MAG: hypothetical protein IJS62_07960 [Bacteroidales bacterium]|nr:hypothetical protein [Bacteroidales bacterium]